MGVVGRVILALLLPAGLATATFSAHRQEPLAAHSTAAAASMHAKAPHEALGASDTSVNEDETNGAVDLYGNRVTDAVAKYKLDATGTLYELHSPQTELPRLPSPKS